MALGSGERDNLQRMTTTTKDDDPIDPHSAAEVTRLLEHAATGDPRAAEQLLPLVYDKLKALAKRKMRHERPDHTLQATALVHEAFLRLVDHPDSREWAGRQHFFAAAAEAMRRILIENARAKGRLKRGGGANAQRITLDAVELTIDDPPDDLLALEEALTELETKQPANAQLVKLRYFAGLTMEQAADAMGISVRTAGRNWSYARAWLFARIKSQK
jgi:RNA polymerase sigma factor (TIGR02999 family)